MIIALIVAAVLFSAGIIYNCIAKSQESNEVKAYKYYAFAAYYYAVSFLFLALAFTGFMFWINIESGKNYWYLLGKFSL